jgi:hypothetical protein
MRRAAYSLLMVASLYGCATPGIPESALRLPESTLDIRSIQTRTLEASSELNILTATIAVLQDMEFNIDRIEKPLGVITASKVSDADDKSQKTGLFFLDMLCAMGRTAEPGSSWRVQGSDHHSTRDLRQAGPDPGTGTHRHSRDLSDDIRQSAQVSFHTGR